MSSSKQARKASYFDHSAFFAKHRLPKGWIDDGKGSLIKVCKDCKQWVRIDKNGDAHGNMGINCNKPTKET